jgi:predicted phosphodiesterase
MSAVEGEARARRIALFSDVHGNSVALDAVLADIGACNVEEVYCLGDLVGYGPDPSGVLARIRATGIPTIRGNYDDGVGNRRGECGCFYATRQARDDGAASYAFTDQVLNDEEHQWLAALPDDIRLEHSGVRVLLAHGSPRKINEYLLLDREDAQLARLAESAQADVVCVGHVHIPYHRALDTATAGRIHYVSSGSVGKPKDGDPRAAWVELLVGPRDAIETAALGDQAAGPAGQADAWIGAVIHRVTYDVDAVAEEMLRKGLPQTLADALRRA